MAIQMTYYGEETVSNAGTVVAPGVGAAIVTIASGSLPAGVYEVKVNAGLALGTPAVADVNNMELRKAAVVISDLTVVAALAVSATTVFPRIKLDGAQALSVNATGAGTAGVSYSASITATRVS